MISFYPDRTASIGMSHTNKRRVSYVEKNGKLKSIERLYPELVNKYIIGWMQFIKRRIVEKSINTSTY